MEGGWGGGDEFISPATEFSGVLVVFRHVAAALHYMPNAPDKLLHARDGAGMELGDSGDFAVFYLEISLSGDFYSVFTWR